MHLIKHILLIYLLAVVGTDFLVAMHADGASAASSSNTEANPHHIDISYEGPIDHVWNETGQKSTDFTFVDMEEMEAVKAGYRLEIKKVTIRNGQEKYISDSNRHKSPFAYRIALLLSERRNPDLKRPKDLEGIELHVVYGFGIGETRRNRYWAKLSNEMEEKEVTVKIPNNENAATEEEKEILKGIFIGGHIFRVEVQKDGNAKIKFEKELSPGTMKFTVDYSNFPDQKGEISHLYRSNCNVENISNKPKSTFTIDWVTSGIKNAEELHAVMIGIFFKLTDKHGHHRQYRSLYFRDFSYDILEQLFVGGEATILLSAIKDEKSKLTMGAADVDEPKPNPTFFEKVRAIVGI